MSSSVVTTEDGRSVLVRLRPIGGSADMDEGARVISQIEADVSALGPAAHGVSIRYAGALPMNQEQNDWMNEDLRGAAGLACLLLVLVVTLALRRLSAPVVLMARLLLGIASTLACARLLYGQLNLVSGFLVSTLFGALRPRHRLWAGRGATPRRRAALDRTGHPPAFRLALEPVEGGGALVAPWPRSNLTTEHEVMAWSHELHGIRRAAAGLGVRVEVLHENMLAALVLGIAKAEAPRVVMLAAIAVFALLLFDFRRVMPVLLVACSLALGVIWMLAAARFLGIELNVFNQAVLPTILGIGLDTPIHVEHRYAPLGRGS